MKPSFSELGLLTLAGAGAARAVVGSVYSRTRGWNQYSYTIRILRLAVAVMIAVFVLFGLGVLVGLQSGRDLRMALAIIPGAALGFACFYSEFYRAAIELVPNRRDVARLGIIATASC